MGDLNSENVTLNMAFLDTNFSGVNTSTSGFQTNQSMLETNSTHLTFVPTYLKVLDYVNVVCYLLICALGLIGNSLVIYVVLIYAKMKTVTNMYILNLAFSDVLFLSMLPITATTVIVKHWIFGQVMCKIYFVLCAINIFGGAFNLCVMSADRYLAVCHPIRSMKYRTPRIAFCMCLCVWVLCFLFMLPVILYTTTMKHHKFTGKYSCRLEFPATAIIPPGQAFFWYSFILGFVIPVSLISIFYILVIFRLRQIRAAKKSKENRRSHGRVTRLIFTIVAVYFICWLPYWCFQIHHLINDIPTIDVSMVLLINGFTILSYANSMLNPLLYAFLSENFRQSFAKAFKCITPLDKTRSVCNEKSSCPCTGQTYMRAGTSATAEERVELSVMDNSSVASLEPGGEKMCAKVLQDERGFLIPPVKY